MGFMEVGPGAEAKFGATQHGMMPSPVGGETWMIAVEMSKREKRRVPACLAYLVWIGLVLVAFHLRDLLGRIKPLSHP